MERNGATEWSLADDPAPPWQHSSPLQHYALLATVSTAFPTRATHWHGRPSNIHCFPAAAAKRQTVARLTYAAYSAWRGLTKASDHQRINSVIHRARPTPWILLDWLID